MKANELMIGDLVYYNPNVFIEDEYEPTKELEVTCIDSGEDIDLAEEGCYTPIPLTTELLEKNGWEKAIGNNPVEVWSINKGIYLHNTDNGYKFREGAEFNVPNIQYVHTLQHILRLCRLSNLADNFKVN